MDYVLVEKGAVLNWFDVEAPEGRYCLNDTVADIMKSFFGKLWFVGVGLKIKKMMSGKGKKSDDKKSAGFEVDLKPGGGIMDMLGGFTVLRLTSMMGMMNVLSCRYRSVSSCACNEKVF